MLGLRSARGNRDADAGRSLAPATRKQFSLEHIPERQSGLTCHRQETYICGHWPIQNATEKTDTPQPRTRS